MLAIFEMSACNGRVVRFRVWWGHSESCRYVHVWHSDVRLRYSARTCYFVDVVSRNTMVPDLVFCPSSNNVVMGNLLFTHVRPSAYSIDSGLQIWNLKWTGVRDKFKYENGREILRCRKLTPFKIYEKIKLLMRTIPQYHEVEERLISAEH